MEINPNQTLQLPEKECLFELNQVDIQDLRGFFAFYALVMSLLAPPTVLLNLLILVGIYKNPSLHSPSNLLLAGLAVTDLGTGALAMPLLIVDAVAHAINSPEMRCNTLFLYRVLVPPFSGVSFVTVTLISVDRMVALLCHMRYVTLVTNQRIVSALVVFWIMGYFISSSNLWYSALMSWATVVIFAGCLIICSANNVIIYRILHRHRVAIEQQQQQIQTNMNISMTHRRKTSSNMLWIYVIFLLFYGPFLVVRILRNFHANNTKAIYLAFRIPYGLMYANSLANPILYCIKMRPIRRALYNLVPEVVRSCMGLRIPD